MLTFGSLFAGIGGMDLGLERAGAFCKWQVEKDEFRRRVLAKHWPDVPRFEDVRNVGEHNLQAVDLIAGGFPCQDISEANASGRGLDGQLSGLWWEFHRIICELRPWYAIVENVSNITNRGLGRVLGSLADIGYDAEWEVISACSFGAPHTRQRMFIVAYPHRERQEASGTEGNDRGSKVFGWTSHKEHLYSVTVAGRSHRGASWELEPRLDRMADGVPDRVDRLGALGDAVVPQVAEWIGRRIIEHVALTNNGNLL